jgi:predicted dienelactone hydrolase
VHRLAVAVLSIAGCAGEVDPSTEPRDPDLRGPWQVGVTTFELVGPDGRPFPVELWYPARPGDGAEPDVQLGITAGAYRDAAPDERGAPFPLIGFSHGSSGLRFQSIYLTEHLVSHGYVVVAPDHLDNTAFDDDPERLPEVFRRRPHAVRESIDAALERGAADPDRIGVAGHSFGATTALLLVGARVDVDAMRAACASEPDDLVCGGVDDALTQEIADGFVDPRLATAVSIAPGGIVAFGADGLAAAAAPVQVQGGTLDTFTPLDTEVRPLHDGLPAPKELLVVEGAAHFSFTDICPLYDLLGGPDGMLAFLATEGCGANTTPVAEVQAVSRSAAVRFFDEHLR